MIERDKRLGHLDPRFLPSALLLLGRLTEARIPVVVVETFRSEAAHQEDLAAGRSWIARSKHQDGLAIDLCPFEHYELHGQDKLQWDAQDPIWIRIGEIGEACGLVWGGRWLHRDVGHFELPTRLSVPTTEL